MWKVDIYLDTDSAYQRKRQRKCGYVLATIVRGEEKTKESFAIANGTYHQTTLQTLIEALSRMTAPSQICIHTQDDYVASRLTKLEEMAASGWIDTKKQPIKNQEEWKQIYNLAHAFPEPHEIAARSEKHSYSTWMQEEMRKNECRRIMGERVEPAPGAETGVNGIPGNHNSCMS